MSDRNLAMKLKTFCLVVAFGVLECFADSPTPVGTVTDSQSDVCVYAASAAGIMAAVAAAREGYSVMIVEPMEKIGGLLGSGFRMQQDAPTGEHLGGLTGRWYLKDVAQPPMKHYQAASPFNIRELQALIDTYGNKIKVVLNHRVVTVKKTNGKIVSATFEHAPPDENGVPAPSSISGNTLIVSAKMFIDASYEGDLMAQAGVTYRVGKESREEYGESLAGTVVSRKFPGVDPYVEKGNPASGLLSCITPDALGKEGDSSRFFMGYNFKLAWERDPSVPQGKAISAPERKNPDVYELLRRYKEAGYKLTWPEENFNRNELMTGAIPGMQIGYPDGDWATRAKIWKGFVDHVKALNDFAGTELHFIAGINEGTNGWPFLYMRGGRRMVGEYVMTQQDIQLQTEPPTPIAMGYYKIDIYPNRLVVLEDGTLAHEGNVFVLASPGPYQIPYGAIIPRKSECQNLIVPLCMSASHVAYSSIRMEATYMVMGESAGIAAGLALRERKAVQDIDRKNLTSVLKRYGQVLEWDGRGYDFGWRSNIFGEPHPETTRWQTNPEEYRKHPIEELRRSRNQKK